tara:strand:- start:393 stop:635 length:243 start_codon:yes stop_codon:yes gene_type:complete
MDHPNSDNQRNDIRERITEDELRMLQINKMVHVATEMGITVVQEIAAETLKRKPGCTIKEFMKILDKYLEQQKDSANNNQ